MTWNSVIRDFRACSSESHILMEKLFSIYTILGLHDALRDVTPRISEKALYMLYSGVTVCDGLHKQECIVPVTIFFSGCLEVQLNRIPWLSLEIFHSPYRKKGI